MAAPNWIIKNTTNCTFFTLLSGGTFVTELELAQRFTSESDAMLCIEQNIDSDEAFAKFGFDVDCFPAPIIENGMTVKYRAPENAEEKDLLFTVIDASNQDWIVFQAVNSSLALPPVEGLNSLDLTVVETPAETAKENINGWIKTPWFGNSELDITAYMKIIRRVKIWVWKSNEENGFKNYMSFTVNAGANSDRSYTGSFYPNENITFQEAIAELEKREQNNKLF